MIEKLIIWSQENYKDLPWRNNRTLYSTLVSEIMLQQTTVSTVKNHFARFIKKYPTVADLALIDEEQMLKEWKGLGYYRRARNLLNAVKEIQDNYHGEIPLDYEKLISIKGIGAYTANAILAIGADQYALALDANLERVLARLYALDAHKGIKLQKQIHESYTKGLLAQEIKQVGGRAYNEALMDLGRNFCTARKAHCDLCPLSRKCLSLKDGNPQDYPKVADGQKISKKAELDLLRVIVRKGDAVLAYKKSEDQWLTGQFEIPTFVMSSSEVSFKQYPRKVAEDFYFLPSFKTGITHYKIINYTIEMNEKEFRTLTSENYEFHPIDDGNLSTASLKAINL